MKQFLVKVRASLPYPVEKDYRQNASTIACAVQRSIKQFRKDKPKKKISELFINAKFIGNYEISARTE